MGSEPELHHRAHCCFLLFSEQCIRRCQRLSVLWWIRLSCCRDNHQFCPLFHEYRVWRRAGHIARWTEWVDVLWWGIMHVCHMCHVCEQTDDVSWYEGDSAWPQWPGDLWENVWPGMAGCIENPGLSVTVCTVIHNPCESDWSPGLVDIACLVHDVAH